LEVFPENYTTIRGNSQRGIRPAFSSLKDDFLDDFLKDVKKARIIVTVSW